MRLGITDHKGHGDFTISLQGEDYEGEAFNVAPSFLKTKLRNTLKKWKDNPKLTHILINEDSLKKQHLQRARYPCFYRSKLGTFPLDDQVIKKHFHYKL